MMNAMSMIIDEGKHHRILNVSSPISIYDTVDFSSLINAHELLIYFTYSRLAADQLQAAENQLCVLYLGQMLHFDEAGSQHISMETACMEPSLHCYEFGLYIPSATRSIFHAHQAHLPHHQLQIMPVTECFSDTQNTDQYLNFNAKADNSCLTECTQAEAPTTRKRPSQSTYDIQLAAQTINANKRLHLEIGSSSDLDDKIKQEADSASVLGSVTKSTGAAFSANFKPRARQGSAAYDPQSVVARHRREQISKRLKVLQNLVPTESKVDVVTILEKTVNYVKFLQLQLKVLTADEVKPNEDQGKVQDDKEANEVSWKTTTNDDQAKNTKQAKIVPL